MSRLSRVIRECRAERGLLAAAVHCRYLGDWVATEHRWSLAVDPAEREALLRYAADCPDSRILSPLGRLTSSTGKTYEFEACGSGTRKTFSVTYDSINSAQVTLRLR
ncbi:MULTISPECIES: hypothetical protein [Streptomyces]|uniref:hypothetical protein n=1 Tax=Streptomyces TaxID=1883 RepID=UPI00160CE24B|nr:MULTISPECIES: hypothetical protein [Streptomyces]